MSVVYVCVCVYIEYLVGHFQKRGCPAVKLQDPVGQSTGEEMEVAREEGGGKEGVEGDRYEVGVQQYHLLNITFTSLAHPLPPPHTITHNHSSREGYYDEVGSVDSLLLNEVRAEGNGLDGLPQTHLVCQDTVEVVVVQRD